MTNTKYWAGPANLLPGTPSGQPGAITLQTPLVAAVSARMALHCGENSLWERIHNGDIEWAFDLRRTGAKRVHLVILTDSIVRLQQRERELKPRLPGPRAARSFEPLFHAMFAHIRPHLSTTELARAWSCSPNHIHRLVADGQLEVQQKEYLPREPWKIVRESALRFMESRRVR